MLLGEGIIYNLGEALPSLLAMARLSLFRTTDETVDGKELNA